MNTGDPQAPLIFVADDDAIVRQLIARTLQNAGFVVRAYADGRELLDAMHADAPDLLVLDVDMPRLDGFETCREVRRLARWRHLPILIATAYEDLPSIEQAFEAGATDFVSKPVNWSLLPYRLRYMLRYGESVGRLKASEQRNRALIDALPDLTLLVDFDGKVSDIVQSSAELDYLEPERLVGRHVRDIRPDVFSKRRMAAIFEALRGGSDYQAENSVRRNGSEYWIEWRVTPFDARHALVLVRDISYRRRAEERIRQLAYFDALTGLPNRDCFMDELGKRLCGSDAAPLPLRCLVVELDRFERVVHGLGARFSDELLKAVGERLQALVASGDGAGVEREAALVARLGEKQFGILEPLGEEQERAGLAAAVVRACEAPFRVDGLDFFVSAQVGVSLYPEHGDHAPALLENAGRALLDTNGETPVQVFSTQSAVRLRHRFNMESRLRQALAGDELFLEYQPKFSLLGGEISGVEALLRWQDGNGERIGPDEFIPVAEESGLIVAIGDRVLDEACRQMRAWLDAGFDVGSMAVNVSALQFAVGDFVQSVDDAVRRHELEHAALQLEITESVLVHQIDNSLQALPAIRELGVQLAIDDFGTGYSSLVYLKQLAVDCLKIDRAFVRDICEEPESIRICQAIIAMARGLDLYIVAEGIETPQQLAYLRDAGCDAGQGYLLGRPMSAADVPGLEPFPVAESCAGYAVPRLAELRTTHRGLQLGAGR